METYILPDKDKRAELRARGIFPFSRRVNSCAVLLSAVLSFVIFRNSTFDNILKVTQLADSQGAALQVGLLIDISRKLFISLAGFTAVALMIRILFSLAQSRFYFRVGLFRNRSAGRASRPWSAGLFILSLLSGLVLTLIIGFIASRQLFSSFGFYKAEYQAVASTDHLESKEPSSGIIKSAGNGFSVDLDTFKKTFLITVALSAGLMLVLSFLTSWIKFMIDNRE